MKRDCLMGRGFFLGEDGALELAVVTATQHCDHTKRY